MQWEYQSVKFKINGLMSQKFDVEEFDQLLNHMGLSGWELVNTVCPSHSGQAKLVVAIFKRQVTQS